MELKEINGNAVANPLQELQTRNGSTALAPSNGVATKDPSLASKENHQENPKVNLVEQPHLDKSQITMKVNGKTTPGTNGTQAIHLTLNDAQVANPTTSGQEEANKTPIPEIHINGEDGESPVSADIMRPEDEDDGDDAPLFERGSTEVGQKPKKKKKSKSKRGLVSQPLCHHARMILTPELRKRPVDLRNTTSMLHSHLPSMRKRRVSTTGKYSRIN